MKMIIKNTFCIIGVLMLSSCTLYQKPETPVPNFPQAFKVSVKEIDPELKNDWWENFNDPTLNNLVQKALKTNYSYQIALKNIDIAQTYVDISMTALFPQLGVDFSTSRNLGIVNVGNSSSSAPQLASPSAAPVPFNLSLLAATVSYEVDVWNQAHNAVEQAKANKFSTEANTSVMRLTLVSSVVNAYFQIAALTQNVDNLQKQEAAAKEILDLTRIQYDSGLIDESGVFQASTQLENIKIVLNTNVKKYDILEYGLAYLVGEFPENFSITPTLDLDKVKLTRLIPAGIPSQVISTRPDVQSTLGQILAYGYLEKQNIANFLPSFSLSATYGFASQTLSHLTKGTNELWNYGANVIQILLNYPALLAQYKQSKLQYESAVLNYQNTVQNAFVEVNSALVSYEEDFKMFQSYKIEKHNSTELLGIAKAQYDAGLTNYVNYLTNDLLLLQSDYNLTNQRVVVLQDIVQAYKSMGLGLDIKPNDINPS